MAADRGCKADDVCAVCQAEVLEPRLRVALQNSKHSFDSACPLFAPDNAQNLLHSYAEEARNENPSTGNCK